MKKITKILVTSLLVLSLFVNVFPKIPAVASNTNNTKAPVLSIDFASGAGDVTLTGAEIVSNSNRGNVLKVSGNGDRTSYGTYTTDVFSTTDWANGMTLSAWVQTSEGSNVHGTTPLYCIDMANQGYIATLCSLETTTNTNGNQGGFVEPCLWNDPVNSAGGVNKTIEGRWQLVTVVYDPVNDNIKIYVDGQYYSTNKLNNTNGVADGNVKLLLTEQIKIAKTITLGSWNCPFFPKGDYKGLIDDFKLWNTVLTGDDINALYESTKGSGDDNAPLVSIDFANGAGNVELTGAEIVEDSSRGNVLRIDGNGNRTSYGTYTTNVFSTTDWTGGLTLSAWIQTSKGSNIHGTTPFYCIDMANYGYVATLCSLETTTNSNGNDTAFVNPTIWNDPENAQGGKNKTVEGEWQLVTVVYDPVDDDIKIYVDGQYYSTNKLNAILNGNVYAELDGGNVKCLLTEQLKIAKTITFGSWNCPFFPKGDYRGLIDDFNLWNRVLAADEIKNLYESTKGEESGESGDNEDGVTEVPDISMPSISVQRPLEAIDFANGEEDVELINASIVSDATRGKVLRVNGNGHRTSHGIYYTDVFMDNDWTGGMTVSMWIKTMPNSKVHGTTPIYSVDMATQGYIAMVCSLETVTNSNGNQASGIEPLIWNDPVDANGGVNQTAEDQWQFITVVYDPNDDNIKIYVDGEYSSANTLNNTDGATEGNVAVLMRQIMCAKSITLGSWNSPWFTKGDYRGLIDDVNIWNTVLAQDDIVELYEATKEGASLPAINEDIHVSIDGPVLPKSNSAQTIGYQCTVGGTDVANVTELGMLVTMREYVTSEKVTTDDLKETIAKDKTEYIKKAVINDVDVISRIVHNADNPGVFFANVGNISFDYYGARYIVRVYVKDSAGNVYYSDCAEHSVISVVKKYLEFCIDNNISGISDVVSKNESTGKLAYTENYSPSILGDNGAKLLEWLNKNVEAIENKVDEIATKQ